MFCTTTLSTSLHFTNRLSLPFYTFNHCTFFLYTYLSKVTNPLFFFYHHSIFITILCDHHVEKSASLFFVFDKHFLLYIPFYRKSLSITLICKRFTRYYSSNCISPLYLIFYKLSLFFGNIIDFVRQRCYTKCTLFVIIHKLIFYKQLYLVPINLFIFLKIIIIHGR